MDRNVRDALEPGRRALPASRSRPACRCARFAAMSAVVGQRGTDVVDRLEIEARQPEQRPQDAQHLPRGARLAERLHHAVERLRAPFAIDERARGLGVRADGQQRVGVVRAVPERRHHDDEVGLLERGARRDRVRAVELRLRAEQEVRLARLREHRPRVQSVLGLRHRIGDVAPDAVRGLDEAAELRADDFGERLRQREELRGFRVLLGVVAEQDRLALAAEEARGDHLRGGDGLDAGERRGNRLAGALRRGDDDLGQRVAAATTARRRTNARRESGSRRRPNAGPRPPRPCAPRGAGAARRADGPCAGSCR